MTDKTPSEVIAVTAAEVAPRTKPSVYPEPFSSRIEGREKRQLGDLFGLKNFGVNQTRLAPNSESALLHRHTKQDEFIYILEGEPTLVTEDEEVLLCPGMCAGFPTNGSAHQLVNRTDKNVVYLEIGDRSAGDEVSYPNEDLKAVFGDDGKWQFLHKDGAPY